MSCESQQPRLVTCCETDNSQQAVYNDYLGPLLSKISGYYSIMSYEKDPKAEELWRQRNSYEESLETKYTLAIQDFPGSPQELVSLNLDYFSEGSSYWLLKEFMRKTLKSAYITAQELPEQERQQQLLNIAQAYISRQKHLRERGIIFTANFDPIQGMSLTDALVQANQDADALALLGEEVAFREIPIIPTLLYYLQKNHKVSPEKLAQTQKYSKSVLTTIDHPDDAGLIYQAQALTHIIYGDKEQAQQSITGGIDALLKNEFRHAKPDSEIIKNFALIAACLLGPDAEDTRILQVLGNSLYEETLARWRKMGIMDEETIQKNTVTVHSPLLVAQPNELLARLVKIYGIFKQVKALYTVSPPRRRFS